MRRLGLLAVCCAAFGCADIDEALARRRDGGGAATGGGTTTGGGGGGEATGGGGGSSPTTGGVCLGELCWENPLPQGNALNAVWGKSGDDVWLVGSAGMVLHWTPAGWQSHQAAFPTSQGLRSVWGAGRHVWVVGTLDDSVPTSVPMKPMHFDGNVWNVEQWQGNADPSLLSVRGRDEDEVWASGLSGVIARRNDAGVWVSRTSEYAQREDGGTARDVALTSLALDNAGNCLVALSGELNGVGPCDGGALELSLDASWAIPNNGLSVLANGEFRAASTRTRTLPNLSTEGNLWVRGSDGGWVNDYSGSPNCQAISAQGTYGLAYCGNGALLEGTPPRAENANGLDSSQTYLGLWTPGTLIDSWLVGLGGAQYRFVGNGWQAMQSGPVDIVFSLWVDAQRVEGVGSSNTAFTRAVDARWSREDLVNGEGETRDLWVSADGTFRVYAGVNRMLLEGAGPSSATQALGVNKAPPAEGRQLNALWGTSPEDLWAAGNDAELWHRTDAGWSRSTLFPDGGQQLWDLDGTDERTAYAVGTGCLVLKRDATADGGWVRLSPPACSDELFGVWAAPPNDAGLKVVAVGSRTWFRKNGNWLNVDPRSNSNTLYKVWGTGPNDIWAVGDSGTLIHFNGTAWSRVETGTRYRLEAVRGRRTGTGLLELFVAGENGTVLRRLAP